MFEYPCINQNSIILRRPEMKDAARFCFLFPIEMKKEKAEQMITSFYGSYMQEKEMILTIADETDQAVGILELYHIEKDTVEIGYRILPVCQRKGYACNAVKTCIHWLKNMHVKKIIARVEETNPASIHVLIKNGFVKDEKDPELYRYQQEEYK